MALSDFFNGYASVSLYSRFPYAHIRYILHKKMLRVAQKNVTCCIKNVLPVAQKTVVSTKKIFHIEVTLRTKIMSVTKKYVVATKIIL